MLSLMMFPEKVSSVSSVEKKRADCYVRLLPVKLVLL